MDYTKPVMSLLNKLQKKGCEIVSVHDGEEWVKCDGNNLNCRKDATDAILSVDESLVKIKYNDEVAKLIIVLGNEPSEILCDYSYKEGSNLETILEEVSDEFYTQWEKV